MDDNDTAPHEIRNRLDSLIGKRCWYVNAGGAAQGASFSLQLGERVLRQRPLRMVSDEFKTHRGEFRVLVWCDWRLGTLKMPLGSSDEAPEKVKRALDCLVGLCVCSAVCVPPAWDLRIEFEKGLLLWVFANYIPGDPSMDRNWELWNRNEALLVGPGYDWRIYVTTDQ